MLIFSLFLANIQTFHNDGNLGNYLILFHTEWTIDNLEMNVQMLVKWVISKTDELRNKKTDIVLQH